jgi:hypothetical protein
MGIYGIKPIKSISANDIYYPQNYVKCDECFYTEADSTKYAKLLGFSQTIDNNFKNKISQPLQVRLYINDTLTDLTVNCDLGGFPLLSWNKFGILAQHNEFKKSPYFQNFIWSDEIDLWKKKPTERKVFNTANVKIVVYWVKFIKKQSRHLFKTIDKFQQKKLPIQLFFVNFDMTSIALERIGSCEATQR